MKKGTILIDNGNLGLYIGDDVCPKDIQHSCKRNPIAIALFSDDTYASELLDSIKKATAEDILNADPKEVKWVKRNREILLQSEYFFFPKDYSIPRDGSDSPIFVNCRGIDQGSCEIFVDVDWEMEVRDSSSSSGKVLKFRRKQNKTTWK